MARRATRPATKVEAPLVRKTPTAVRAAKVSAPRSTHPRKLDLDGMSAEQKVAVLLREREKLLGQLEAASARVASMEARDEQLIDRITWALDTLADLLGEGG